MKYYLLAVLFCIGLYGIAQEDMPLPQRDQAPEFTPEQRASLKTKKLTLALDLSEAQQQKVEKLQLEQARDRAARREARKAENSRENRSSEERYDALSEQMDKRIAYQREMKSILTAEQFEKWQSINERHGKNRHRRHGRKSREHNPHHRAH